MSGAGTTKHTMQRVERGYQRNLRAVSGDYVQDVITYRRGFWQQYGWQIFMVMLALVASLTMGAAVIMDTIGLITVDGKGAREGIFFMALASLTMTPLLAITPFVWYRSYARQIAVLEGREDKEAESRVTEVLE